MDLKLAGKVVVVTGATANIGRAIALEFAGEGVKLVAVGPDEQAGERLIAQAQSGARLEPYSSAPTCSIPCLRRG